LSRRRRWAVAGCAKMAAFSKKFHWIIDPTDE
jgi:hypothetical protein